MSLAIERSVSLSNSLSNNVRRIVGTDDNIRVDTTVFIYESNVAVDVATRVRHNKENN